jgi:hypothetical protein
VGGAKVAPIPLARWTESPYNIVTVRRVRGAGERFSDTSES